MADRQWLTTSADETVALGRELGAQLRAPLIVFLLGDLGAGKTTLAKGVISGAGAAREEDVTSPTFTLVHVFHNHQILYHVDLYRIADFHDLETLGLEDVFDRPSIVLIEWAEKFTLRTNWPVIRVRLEHAGDDTRRIRLEDPAGVLAEAKSAL